MSFIFYFFILLLSLATLHSFYGLYLIIISKRNILNTGKDFQPSITVQLPIFNELNVAKRVIDSVANSEYPSDKLHIQVLDDSNDETKSICENLCKDYKMKGLNIEYIHRKDRMNYKAGALKNGLKTAQGEFVAIFDSDFVPDKTFLNDLIVHFDRNTDCVQAKWEYLNPNTNILTKIQALNLDHHFNIFQNSRYNSNNLLNFNGTAGIWRKSTLVELGAWDQDTIVEDLDFSIRAQIVGKKIKYVNDVKCKSELPEKFSDLEIQQKRWIKGSAQVLKKHLFSILKSELELSKKINSLIFLTYNLIFPIITIITILNIPVYFFLKSSNFNTDYLLIFLSSGFFIGLQHLISQQYKISKIFYLPLLMLGSLGLSISLTFSFISGLFTKNSKFERTPKNGLKKIKNYSNLKLSYLIILEFAMLLYYLIFSLYLISISDYVALFFQLFFILGFGIVIVKRLKIFSKLNLIKSQ